MITPSFGLTATEKVLPKLALDFTTASLDPRITFTRADATATRVNSSGSIEAVNADVARFDYDPSTLVCKGLLIEESRVNSIRNNTMQGAVAGSLGTIPTNWQTNAVSSMAFEVAGVGTENGIEYVDFRFFGTASGTTSSSIQFEQNSQIAASTGQNWAASTYIKVVAGSLTGVSLVRFGWEERSGVFLAYNSVSFTPASTGLLINNRRTHAATNANASTTFVKPLILFTPVNGAAIDVTVRIGLPQMELGAFATSVIKTSTAAVTRNADVATMTGTNFSSWFNASEGTLSGNFTTGQDTLGTRVALIDDASTSNVIGLYGSTGGGLGPYLSIINTTVTQCQIPTLSSISANTTYTIVGAYKLDNFAAAKNGATTGTDTSGTIPTVTQMALGRDSGSTANYLNGWLRKISYWPQRLTNAEVQAFSK